MGQAAGLLDELRQFVKKLEGRVTAQTAAAALGRFMPLARDGVGHHVLDAKFSRDEQTRLGPLLDEILRRFSRYRRAYA